MHWSNNVNSYPPHKTAEEWQAELAMYGAVLLRYGSDIVNADEYSAGKAYNYATEEWVAGVEAKHAMVWVAENFHDLWD